MKDPLASGLWLGAVCACWNVVDPFYVLLAQLLLLAAMGDTAAQPK